MDSLLSVVIGLGLRLLVDIVSNHNIKVGGALVGIWEGVALSHLSNKSTPSFEPYMAYGLRLLVDFIFTGNSSRMVIILLWTVLGLLSTDALLPNHWYDTTHERRVESILPVPPRVPRAQSRDMPSRSISFQRTHAVTPTIPHPVFPLDTHPAVRQNFAYSLPPHRPPQTETLDELEFVTRPATTHYNKSNNSSDQRPTIPETSTSTTSTIDQESNADSDSTNLTFYGGAHSAMVNPPISTLVFSGGLQLDDTKDPPSSNHSMTIDHDQPNQDDTPISHTLSRPPSFLLSPLNLIANSRDMGASASSTIPVSSRASLPVVNNQTSMATSSHHIHGPTISPPRADVAQERGSRSIAGSGHDSQSTAETLSTKADADNVITPDNTDADFLRREARSEEKETSRLKNERQKAQKEGRIKDAALLLGETNDSEKRSLKLHRQADRRYFLADNAPQLPRTIDVHRLQISGAVQKTEEALRHFLNSSDISLRVIIGQGNHARAIKFAIIRELEKQKLPHSTGPEFLIITHPP